ncbi:type II secretion system F family protein [Candidatus Sumerlaeota bacterium]|nr:type II secretion system F family protein [Candidatus Sumerlaeota bacterium]
MKLTSEQLHQFFSELQGLVRAGAPLGTEMEIEALSDHGAIQRLWVQVHQALERGQTLSQALANRSPQISATTIALIQAGEESGDLLGALEVVAQGHRRRLGVERVTRLALVYPMVVLAFLVGVLVFFGLFVYPPFESLLPQRDVFSPSPGLPGIVGMTFFAARFSIWLATPWGLACAALWILLCLWVISGGLWLHPTMQRRVFPWTPFIGQMVNLSALTRWTHTLGHLLQRRVGVDTALILAEQTLDLRRLTAVSREVRERVGRGVALSSALLQCGLLPRAAAGLIVHAEERGDVDMTLLRLSDHFQSRLEYQIRKFEAWFEPTLILFTGLIVFGAVIMLYLPVFGLFQNSMLFMGVF